MKITEELLKQLDATRVGNGWQLWGPWILTLKQDGTSWTFNDIHSATELEELIVFAFEDGRVRGREEVRREIRETLGLHEAT